MPCFQHRLFGCTRALVLLLEVLVRELGDGRRYWIGLVRWIGGCRAAPSMLLLRRLRVLKLYEWVDERGRVESYAYPFWTWWWPVQRRGA